MAASVLVVLVKLKLEELICCGVIWFSTAAAAVTTTFGFERVVKLEIYDLIYCVFY